MNFKREYKKLLETVKNGLSKAGKPHRSEDIAKDLGYTRSYLSQLVGDNDVKVTEEHVRLLKLQYREMLENEAHETPPSEIVESISNQEIINAIKALIESNRELLQSNNAAVASNKAITESATETNKKMADTNAELVQMLKARSNIPANFDWEVFANNQVSILSHLQVLFDENAEKVSHGDPAKKRKILEETNKKIVESARAHSLKGSRKSTHHN